MLDFETRLCIPTSTSLHDEVAERLRGDHGMLIRLNNSENTFI